MGDLFEREREHKRMLDENAANLVWSTGGEPPNYSPRRGNGRGPSSRWVKLRELVDKVAQGAIPAGEWVQLHNVHIQNICSARAAIRQRAKEHGYMAETSKEGYGGQKICNLWFRLILE